MLHPPWGPRPKVLLVNDFGGSNSSHHFSFNPWMFFLRRGNLMHSIGALGTSSSMSKYTVLSLGNSNLKRLSLGSMNGTTVCNPIDIGVLDLDSKISENSSD